MSPAQLQPESFSSYPREAKQLAASHLELLRKLPLSFLPLLLRETIAYDWKFPVERQELDHQFSFLASFSDPELQQLMASFHRLSVSAELQNTDWVNAPVPFSEQLSAHLWATHQMDQFRAAAVEYIEKLNSGSTKPAKPEMPRLGIVAIGQGVRSNHQYPLFRKLRPHGTYFSELKPDGGGSSILQALAARAAKQHAPHAHWYIDGGTPLPLQSQLVTCVSYAALTPVRARLQKKIQKSFESGMGSELLRTSLAQMQPQEVGMDSGSDAALNHFQLSLFTEGSGTQIYSTTFVQWAAREALRRAQPLTLFARFAPRQHESSMQELLAEAERSPVLDPQGSLIDADMGAYYTWLNQQRLPGAEEAHFLAWFENQREAIVVGPGFGKGVTSKEAVSLPSLVARIS